MTLTVTQKPKNTVELDVALSADEFQAFITKAVKRLSEAVTVPGFRKGNVPEDILVQKLGEKTILEEAAEEAVKQSFANAVADHRLATVGPPKIEVRKLARGNPLEFRATVALLPSVELGDLAKVNVQRKPIEVREDDVTAALEDLRKARRSESAKLAPAEKGDKMEINLDLFRDGVPVEGGQSQNHPVIIGDGTFIPGFEEQLIGLSPNETKEFTLTFPKDYRVKHLAGHPAQFRVTATNLFRLTTPELDDAFAKSLGAFQDLAALKAQIKKNIEAERRLGEEQRTEGELINAIVKASSIGDLPDLLIEEEERKMLDELEHDIEHRGMKMDDYLASLKKSREQLQNEMRPAAARRVKSALVLRELARIHKVSVDREEVERERAKLKEEYADDPAARSRLDDDEVTRYLATLLSNRKLIERLKADHVTSPS
ncbi:MAG: trigger factor [Candidatus Kerfeldbacteria bacterium]|nr:trigger factor [Candidatus Kerfeldbacteria bacterium]